jgi:predicted nucleic acid-binding protein
LARELVYLDSSALVKLVLPERESAALFSTLQAYPLRVASALIATEVPRAIRRVAPSPEAMERSRSVVESIHLLRIDEAVLTQAAGLEPPGLRTLDAIHLATAVGLGDELLAFVSYDLRLIEAARALELPVLSPE